MLGQQVPYTKIPYFFSDQYDVGMEYTGFATEWDEIVYRGDPSTREFIAFFLHHGRLVAGMNVNIWGVAEAIETLVAGGASVDRGVLADADADLSRLAAEATGA
jgi:3-phenylpropionate/trans-cinnamate dioxygenase ferredoxin reductase subunit